MMNYWRSHFFVCFSYRSSINGRRCIKFSCQVSIIAARVLNYWWLWWIFKSRIECIVELYSELLLRRYFKLTILRCGSLKITYVCFFGSTTFNVRFTIYDNISILKLYITRWRWAHRPFVVRICRGFAREVPKQHKTWLVWLKCVGWIKIIIN